MKRRTLDSDVLVYKTYKLFIKYSLFVSTAENRWKLSDLNTFKTRKRKYLPHYWADKYFKGILVNRALPSFHGGSLVIMLNKKILSVTIFYLSVRANYMNCSRRKSLSFYFWSNGSKSSKRSEIKFKCDMACCILK